LRWVTQADIGAALHRKQQIQVTDVARAFVRNRNVELVAVGFDDAEELVLVDLTIGKGRLAERNACRVGVEFKPFAVEIVALRHVEAHDDFVVVGFERVRKRCFGTQDLLLLPCGLLAARKDAGGDQCGGPKHSEVIQEGSHRNRLLFGNGFGEPIEISRRSCINTDSDKLREFIA